MSSMSPDLNITVDANVQPYERNIERARTATTRYQNSLSQLEADLLALEKSIDDHATAALERQHQAMDKTGKAVFTFGALVAAGLGFAVNEAIQWESAWAGVTKTVDGNAQQMALLEDQLRSLTNVLPASHEEIAAVAEAAGQLGVAREDVAAFTKTAIDLGETTDLAAEQAATSLAQLMNIMQSAPADVSRLGSTVVELGNNGASTESQIVDMALRVAGAGRMVAASESDVLALSSAMADLGIQSELGGGAIQRTFIKINSAVSENGELLEGFASLAGMSAQEFAFAWGTSPVEAFDKLIQGMGRVQTSGGDLAQVLDGLGLEGTQNLQVLLRMAGAGDILTDSLARASQEWDENNALLAEAAKRYETTEAQIQLARNQLRDAGIDIGSTLLPAVAAVIDTGADLLKFWQELPGPVKASVTVLAAAAAAIALFSGAALIAVPRIAAFNAAVASLEAGALKTAGTRVAAMGSLLAGPWGIALAAGITAVGIFGAKHGAAARQVDAMAAALDQVTGAMTAESRELIFKDLYDSGALDQIKSITAYIEQMRELVPEVGDALGDAFGDLDTKDFFDAATGDPAALERTRDAIDALDDAVRRLHDEGELGNEPYKSLTLDAIQLREALSKSNGTIDEAREKIKLRSEAGIDDAEASDTAASAQQRLTGAWEAGADAAGELGEEIQTLGEDLESLSEDYLSNRAAGRAIRDQLREIRRATREYREEHGTLVGAFKSGTESGDGFASMLDDLARDYINQIDATERVTGSQAAVRRQYRLSREALKEVAQELGMTEEAAKRYVNEVLGTPEIIRTRFETPGLEAATSAMLNYRSAIDAVPRGLHTVALPPASPAPKKKEDGGVVTAYASGGFSFGSRTGVAREPMIARGGANILWAEPATGWEAYISGKPGMETRNRDVWAEAGRRLGMTAAGTQTVERTVIVKQMLPDRLTLDVDGRSMTAYVRGHARDVTGREIDRREAGQGVRGRMNGWGE